MSTTNLLQQDHLAGHLSICSLVSTPQSHEGHPAGYCIAYWETSSPTGNQLWTNLTTKCFISYVFQKALPCSNQLANLNWVCHPYFIQIYFSISFSYANCLICRLNLEMIVPCGRCTSTQHSWISLTFTGFSMRGYTYSPALLSASTFIWASKSSWW